jgi:hypothetical protein
VRLFFGDKNVFSPVLSDWCINTLLRTTPGHPPVMAATDKFYAKLWYVFPPAQSPLIYHGFQWTWRSLDAVENWFKNIDIAQQEYLVFPVNWKG